MAYFVRDGSILPEFESLVVTFDVAFAENAGEIEERTGTVMASRYDPTPTALPTPAGGCRTVDLTEIDGTHSLGNFTVP